MKKYYFILAAVVLFASSAIAQTWTLQQSSTIQGLWSVVFINNNTGFVCGTGGVILKTTNSGTNWILKTSGTTHDLMFIQFLNSSTGICASVQGPLLRTTNTGETWSVIAFGSLPAANALGGGWFSDLNNGVIAYGQSNYSQSRILKTVNGGISWDTVYSPVPSIQGWISYMHFPDSQNGYATVAYNTVYKTTNGGLNWTSLNLGGNQNLWTSGVYFLNSQTGFVGGGVYSTMTGDLFKTTNGGANWQLITSAYGIAKIQFADNSNGYCIAANNSVGNGLLIKTSDGGNNWSVFTTPLDSLNGMHFISSALGYAVGVRGRILRYGFPIGINNISSNVPGKFSLSQNYPNPFNPNTVIRFQVQIAGFVSLKVYDVSGKEVETIINEKLNPGTYEASFEGSGLNSGVYFYKISAGSFSETKKMILLK